MNLQFFSRLSNFVSSQYGFSQHGWKIAQVRWSECIAEIWFFLKYFESRTFFLSSILFTISNVKNNISPFLIWQSISVNHCVCTKGHSQFHSIFIFAKFSVFSYFLSKVNQIILLGIFHFFSSKNSTLRFFLQKCLQKCYNDWIQRRFNLKHQWIQSCWFHWCIVLSCIWFWVTSKYSKPPYKLFTDEIDALNYGRIKRKVFLFHFRL